MSIVGTTLGRYRLLEKIGSGGFATVYLGIDTRLNEPVAVKVLLDQADHDPTVAQRFEREARALRKLPAHQNIVGLRDFGNVDGVHYLVMDYAPGYDLSEILRRQRKLPVIDAVDIAVQVAGALKAAFEVGLVHRDIKPENIRLLPDRTVKLLDFGIARDTSAARLTQAGLLAGTAAYVAPEVWRGLSPDHASDIYALGCVFYEMLVGQPPFVGDTPESIMHGHLEQAPDIARAADAGAPTGVCDALERMLAKNQDDRPATSELLDELPPYGRSRKSQAYVIPPLDPLDAQPGGAAATGDLSARDNEDTRPNLRAAKPARRKPARNGASRAGAIAFSLFMLLAGLAAGAAAVASFGLPYALELRAGLLSPAPAALARGLAEALRATAEPAAVAAAAPATSTATVVTSPAPDITVMPDITPTLAAGAAVTPTRVANTDSIYNWIPGRLRALPNGQRMQWFIDDTSPGLHLDPPVESVTGKRIWGRLDYIDQADYGTGYLTIRAGDTAVISWTMDVPFQPGFYEVFAYRPFYVRDFVAEVVPYQVYLDGQPLQPFAGSAVVNQAQTRGQWVSLGGYEITRPGVLSVRLNSEAARPLVYEVDVDAIGIVKLESAKLVSQ
jgi:serine/threonine-protein kinase